MLTLVSLLLCIFGAWGWLQTGMTMFAISLLFSGATVAETIWCKWNSNSVGQTELSILGLLIIVTNLLNFAGIVAGLVITFCK